MLFGQKLFQLTFIDRNYSLASIERHRKLNSHLIVLYTATSVSISARGGSRIVLYTATSLYRFQPGADPGLFYIRQHLYRFQPEADIEKNLICIRQYISKKNEILRCQMVADQGVYNFELLSIIGTNTLQICYFPQMSTLIIAKIGPSSAYIYALSDLVRSTLV